jgi:predicted metal-dependent peptidase
MEQVIDLQDAVVALHEAKFDLLSLQPFYAILLQKHSFRWDDNVGTAGVGVTTKGVPTLYVAPKFFLSLNKFERIGLLMHEMLHVVMRHIARGKDLHQKLANVAMDIAINQMIPVELLPNGALLPEQFDLKLGESFEFYYIALLNSSKESSSMSTLDNHDYCDPQNGEIESVTQAATDQAIADAFKTCRDNFSGRVPREVEKIFQDYLAEKTKTNWKSILKSYVGRNTSSEKESTRCRPNRRQGFMAAGMKRIESPKVLIGIDHSGSVSASMVAQFENELRMILSNLTDRTEVAYFDTKIHTVEKLKDCRGRPATRRASGGTDFNSIADHARNQRPDVLVIFTDGEAPMPSVPVRCPIVWCIIGEYPDTHLKGRKIRLAWESGKFKN